MAKMKPDPQTVALEALTQALADATPRPLFGTAKASGYFKGSTQVVKDAAALCRERGWLEATGEFSGKGKSKKELFRLTAGGVRAALEQSPTLHLLEGVRAAVERQVATLGEQQQALTRLGEQVRPIQDAVAALMHRIKPPPLEELTGRLAPRSEPATTPEPAAAPAWLDRVVAAAEQQRTRDRHLPLSLPEVYQQVRTTNSHLTLGEFHDGLRTLREQRRIRLVPFTRSYATIPDLRNALFLDGEVMFYVDLP